MATPVYKGDTGFRIVGYTPTHNREGFDSLSVRCQGADSSASSFAESWTKGKAAASLSSLDGGSELNTLTTMFLQTKSVNRSGAIATVDLNFIGYIESMALTTGISVVNSSATNPVSVQSSIGRMAVSLTTTNDESVNFEYNGETTTVRWLHYGATAPLSPRFPIRVPSEVGVGSLYNPNPANFTGSVEAKMQGNLAGFVRDQLAPQVWGVIETWELRILPITSIAIAE